MDEFRGTVSLCKPFLEQKEIADFLQISPQASFPKAILYRLSSVAECFIQTKLNGQSSETELASLRLNCEFLKKGSLIEGITSEPETIGLYWVAWGAEAAYNEILDPAAEASGTSPEIPLVHGELDQLTGRICEVLVEKSPDDLKEQIDIVAFLDINLIMSESIIEPTLIERRLRLPRSFRTFRLDTIETVLRQFYHYSSTPCCAGSNNNRFKRKVNNKCNYKEYC